MKIDFEAYIYQLEKEATEAIYSGRNKQYAKGIRDAAKIAKEFSKPGYKVKPSTRKMTGYKTGDLVEYTVCGNCNTWILEKEAHYCANCGQEIDWSEWSDTANDTSEPSK